LEQVVQDKLAILLVEMELIQFSAVLLLLAAVAVQNIRVLERLVDQEAVVPLEMQVERLVLQHKVMLVVQDNHTQGLIVEAEVEVLVKSVLLEHRA
tara:strand:- start:155 stop:442 length:288 start_codon:yes stop_codon:yes gene_type:complete